LDPADVDEAVNKKSRRAVGVVALIILAGLLIAFFSVPVFQISILQPVCGVHDVHIESVAYHYFGVGYQSWKYAGCP